MSKEEILSYFSNNAYSYNLKNSFVMLFMGLCVGIVIYITYWLCSEKVVYNRKFNLSILATVLITDLIMLLISSNIVVSLGMVGALSIVRFRTALKDSRDTIFIFWAIAEGLCVGTKSLKLTIASVVFIAIVLLIASKLISGYKKYIFVVAANADFNSDDAEKKIEEKKYKYRLRAFNKNEMRSEYIYELKLRGEIDANFLKDFSKLKGIVSVNCVIETGEVEG